MTLRNEIMLITYPDSLGKNLDELKYILQKHLRGVIGGVHLLPFYPSSADRGFAPSDYTVVDPAFGSYEDVMELGEEFDLMVDFMINHISRQSKQFQDFKKNKDSSPYGRCLSATRTFGQAASHSRRPEENLSAQASPP